jgi:hypothetical protein
LGVLNELINGDASSIGIEAIIKETHTNKRYRILTAITYDFQGQFYFIDRPLRYFVDPDEEYQTALHSIANEWRLAFRKMNALHIDNYLRKKLVGINHAHPKEMH